MAARRQSIGQGRGWRTMIAVALLLWFTLGGVSPASQVPRVVVDIKPLHALLAGLMQGVAEPRLLIDGTQSPWNYRPDAADLAVLDDADLVVWSGRELEPALAGPIAALAPRSRVFGVLDSAALKVLPARHDERLRDPFYWLDSRNMLILLDSFARLLSEIDPDRAPVYQRNWRRMTESLAAVDRELEFGYRDVSGAPVFFYHDTHQYFGQAYAMHVAGTVVQVSGGESADAAQLLATRAEMQVSGRSCLFTEKGLDEPHLDLLLAGGGATAVELDSLGVGLAAGPQLYVNLMRDNFRAISQCVRSLKPPRAVDDTFVAPDVSRSPDRLVPRYLMMDQFGRSVSHEDFQGRLQLIFFGYTYCPDVCPTSLAVMVRALGLLGGDADQIQPIFITVDPERDTRQLLAEYLAWFHPRLLGLSASPEMTRRTAELFRARYEKIPAEDGDPQRYTMDHTASLYLLGRKGEFVTKFAHGLPAPELAARLRDYLND